MDSMRLSLRNIKRVFLTAIALHNFVLNTGGGYFLVDMSEDDASSSYNPDVDVGEDEEHTQTQIAFTELLQGRQFDAMYQRIKRRHNRVNWG